MGLLFHNREFVSLTHNGNRKRTKPVRPTQENCFTYKKETLSAASSRTKPKHRLKGVQRITPARAFAVRKLKNIVRRRLTGETPKRRNVSNQQKCLDMIAPDEVNIDNTFVAHPVHGRGIKLHISRINSIDGVDETTIADSTNQNISTCDQKQCSIHEELIQESNESDVQYTASDDVTLLTPQQTSRIEEGGYNLVPLDLSRRTLNENQERNEASSFSNGSLNHMFMESTGTQCLCHSGELEDLIDSNILDNSHSTREHNPAEEAMELDQLQKMPKDGVFEAVGGFTSSNFIKDCKPEDLQMSGDQKHSVAMLCDDAEIPSVCVKLNNIGDHDITTDNQATDLTVDVTICGDCTDVHQELSRSHLSPATPEDLQTSSEIDIHDLHTAVTSTDDDVCESVKFSSATRMEDSEMKEHSLNDVDTHAVSDSNKACDSVGHNMVDSQLENMTMDGAYEVSDSGSTTSACLIMDDEPEDLRTPGNQADNFTNNVDNADANIAQILPTSPQHKTEDHDTSSDKQDNDLSVDETVLGDGANAHQIPSESSPRSTQTDLQESSNNDIHDQSTVVILTDEAVCESFQQNCSDKDKMNHLPTATTDSQPSPAVAGDEDRAQMIFDLSNKTCSANPEQPGDDNDDIMLADVINDGHDAESTPAKQSEPGDAHKSPDGVVHDLTVDKIDKDAGRFNVPVNSPDHTEPQVLRKSPDDLGNNMGTARDVAESEELNHSQTSKKPYVITDPIDISDDEVCESNTKIQVVRRKNQYSKWGEVPDTDVRCEAMSHDESTQFVQSPQRTSLQKSADQIQQDPSLLLPYERRENMPMAYDQEGCPHPPHPTKCSIRRKRSNVNRVNEYHGHEHQNGVNDCHMQHAIHHVPSFMKPFQASNIELYRKMQMGRQSTDISPPSTEHVIQTDMAHNSTKQHPELHPMNFQNPVATLDPDQPAHPHFKLGDLGHKRHSGSIKRSASEENRPYPVFPDFLARSVVNKSRKDQHVSNSDVHQTKAVIPPSHNGSKPSPLISLRQFVMGQPELQHQFRQEPLNDQSPEIPKKKHQNGVQMSVPHHRGHPHLAQIEHHGHVPRNVALNPLAKHAHQHHVQPTNGSYSKHIIYNQNGSKQQVIHGLPRAIPVVNKVDANTRQNHHPAMYRHLPVHQEITPQNAAKHVQLIHNPAVPLPVNGHSHKLQQTGLPSGMRLAVRAEQQHEKHKAGTHNWNDNHLPSAFTSVVNPPFNPPTNHHHLEGSGDHPAGFRRIVLDGKVLEFPIYEDHSAGEGNIPTNEEIMYEISRRQIRNHAMEPQVSNIMVQQAMTPQYIISDKCGACGKEAKFICQACMKIVYCSPRCQLLSWPEHKDDCCR